MLRVVAILLLLVSPLFADERRARLGIPGENVILNVSTLPQKTPRWLVTNRGSGQVLIGDSTMGLYRKLTTNSKNVGKVFGVWTQVGPAFVVTDIAGARGRSRYAVCQCKCGNVEAKNVKHLGGKLLSHKYCRACNPEQHVGVERRLEYTTWQAMRARCLNTEHRNYHLYGGSGVTICDRWINCFENFYTDMGPRPTRTSQIDRIDNSKGYAPDNCRWVSRTANCRNKTNNRLVAFRGELLPISEIVERTGIARHVFCYRIKQGWSAEDAATKPLLRKRAKA